MAIAAAAFAAGWHFSPGPASPASVIAASRRALAKSPRAEPKAPPPVAPKLPPWDAASPLAKALAASTSAERLAAIQTLVNQTSPGGLAALLDQAAGAPRQRDRALVRQQAYAKWVATNPTGALAHAEAAEQLLGTIPSTEGFGYSSNNDDSPASGDLSLASSTPGTLG